MKPEYRNSIDVNLRRKIEAIVRRKSSLNSEGNDSSSDGTLDEVSPCPMSNELISSYQLESPITKDAIPMCIITGKHLVTDNWCFCPNSKFPALYSEYLDYIDRESTIQSKLAPNSSSKLSNDNSDENIDANGSDFVASNTSPDMSNLTIQVLDPLVNKPISRDMIKLASSDEISKYMLRYNNVISSTNAESTTASTGTSHKISKSKKFGSISKISSDFKANGKYIEYIVYYENDYICSLSTCR